MRRPIVLIGEDCPNNQVLGKDPKGRLIPVVVLTTSEMPFDIAYACVQKPMGFPDLAGFVETIQAFWLTYNVVPPALR